MKQNPKKKPRPPLHDFFLSKSGSSRIQEVRVSEDVGGRKVPMSGARAGDKGDVETKEWLIDAKLTEKRSYALSTKAFRKINTEATAYGKIPALVVEFTHAGLDGVPTKWAVIPYREFLKIFKKEV